MLYAEDVISVSLVQKPMHRCVSIVSNFCETNAAFEEPVMPHVALGPVFEKDNLIRAPTGMVDGIVVKLYPRCPSFDSAFDCQFADPKPLVVNLSSMLSGSISMLLALYLHAVLLLREGTAQRLLSVQGNGPELYLVGPSE